MSFYYCFDARGERGRDHRRRDHQHALGRAPRLRAAGRRTSTAAAHAALPLRQGVPRLAVHAAWTSTTTGASAAPASALARAHGELRRAGARLFDATLALERREITGAALAGALARYPFMTVQVHRRHLLAGAAPLAASASPFTPTRHKRRPSTRRDLTRATNLATQTATVPAATPRRPQRLVLDAPGSASAHGALVACAKATQRRDASASDARGAPAATVHVHDPALLRATSPSAARVGAGEAYMRGHWSADDLTGAGAPAAAQPRGARRRWRAAWRASRRRCGSRRTGCTATRAPAAGATSPRTTTSATSSSRCSSTRR